MFKSRQPSNLSNGVLVSADAVETQSLPDDHASLEVQTESPSVVAARKKVTVNVTDDVALGNIASPSAKTTPMTENIKPSVGFIHKSSLSPTKSKL